MKLFHPTLRSTAYLSASAFAIAAYAVPPAAAQENSASTSSVEAEESGSDHILDRVVVTANKKASFISETPIAVTALSEDALRSAGVVGLKDLTSAVPSVQIRKVNLANSIAVTVRGITNTNFNSGGQPAVATYFDGVYSPRTQGLNGSLYDISRMEVLRGPQGTLYGRNATAGNFNIVTNDPIFDFDAAASVGYGNYNDVMADGMVNIPLSSTLAVRFAGAFHRNDGYYESSGADGVVNRNYGASDDFSGRASLLWAPNDAFSWRLTAEKVSMRGTPGLDYETGPDGDTADGRDPFSNPQVPGFPPPALEIDNLMIRSKMDLDLGGSFSASYIAGYQDLRHLTLIATAGNPVPFADGIREGSDENHYHEVNLFFDSNKISSVTGANYFHEEDRGIRNPARLPRLGIGFSSGAPLGPSNIISSWGVFNQTTYSVTPDLRFTGGIRYSSEEADAGLGGSATLYCPVDLTFEELDARLYTPNEVPNDCFASDVAVPSDGQWSSVTWRAGIEHDLGSRSMMYANATTGFKSGGLNGSVPGVPEAYDPEKATNYELGLKLVQDNFQINTALFYTEYEDLQVVQFFGLQQGITNAAKARIYGLEAEGTWQVSDADSLSGFFTYLNAEYDDYSDAFNSNTNEVVASLDGNRLQNAPEFSARLAYQHEFTLADGSTLEFTPSVYWQSENFTREFNLPIDTVPSYAKLDTTVTYNHIDGNWSVQGYVHNATDELIRSGSTIFGGVYFSDYIAPRTYGVRLSYNY